MQLKKQEECNNGDMKADFYSEGDLLKYIKNIKFEKKKYFNPRNF
jgi:hypothetical protein